MPKKILITGGAGFLGSHLADALIARGDQVLIVDKLLSAVHPDGEIPAYLNPDAEFICADVRETDFFAEELSKADVVFHLAASVGVGQSQYEIASYVDNNVQATAELLHFLVKNKLSPRLIVAGSMSSYGEGRAKLSTTGEEVVPPGARLVRKGSWDAYGIAENEVFQSIPTPETQALQPQSVYASTKRMQEELVQVVSQANGIPATVLRFFNIYGARQSLSNPYTGMLAIFISRSIQGLPLRIFEDGLQRRDLVHVLDVVQACILAMDSDRAVSQVFNVGTGLPLTVREVAEAVLAEFSESNSYIEITNEFRSGDIRHCYADVSKAQEMLGYQAKHLFPSGLRELIDWARGEEISGDPDRSYKELVRNRLVL